jgi:hypothetical protein
VWSAKGLPSTRNWPFRWPLPPATSPPAQVIPKASCVQQSLRCPPPAPVLAVALAAVLARVLRAPVLAVARAAVLAHVLLALVVLAVARAAVLALALLAPPWSHFRATLLFRAFFTAPLHLLLQYPQLYLVPLPLPLPSVYSRVQPLYLHVKAPASSGSFALVGEAEALGERGCQQFVALRCGCGCEGHGLKSVLYVRGGVYEARSTNVDHTARPRGHPPRPRMCTAHCGTGGADRQLRI